MTTEQGDERMKWWDNHMSTCGTRYRGCDPWCQKEQVEQYVAACGKEKNDQIAQLRETLRDLLSCQGSSIMAIMDNADAAKDRARQLLREINE